VAEGDHLKLLKTKTGWLGFHRLASQGSLVAMPLTRGCPFTVPHQDWFDLDPTNLSVNVQTLDEEKAR
jgi:hypothetical protein